MSDETALMPDGIHDLWAVVVNSDTTEGRGIPEDVCYCTHKCTALRKAKGADVQGSNGKVEKRRVPIFDGKVYQLVKKMPKIYTFIHPDDQRQIALLEKAKRHFTEEELDIIRKS